MQFRPTPQPHSPDPDAASTGGGESVDTTVQTIAPDAGAQSAAETTPAAGKPASMLEAMFGQQGEATAAETAEAAATGKTIQQLRDERGRFASGTVEKQPAQPDPNKPPKQPDPNGMPEGLAPKAQERFQALANTNKELTARVQEWEPIVNSALGLQEVFRNNGVKREQFDQAMEVVGLMNRGDLRGALQVLDEQRRLISLHLGQPLPGADALADYPDLRAEVDNLQMTEARALEIARGRMREQGMQAASRQAEQQRQAQEQEQRQASQQAETVKQGQLAVDAFCKARMGDDLDYARIEPMLLKEIQDGLLQGVHPSRWAALIEKTYGLIKQSAAAARSGTTTVGALRPTGGESPRQTPKSMHEAMWGAKA